MSFKKFLAMTLLLAAPVITVQILKKTTWGELHATPAARQKGDPKAKLAVVEFSDFQCPMCASVQPAIKQMMDTYKGKIRFIYKYYPLKTVHQNAMASAHAAECAAQQDKFWDYHDKLFATQVQWAKLADPATSYVAIASQVALDLDKFRACYADPTRRWPVEMDARDGKDRMVNATPTFFVGETRLVGTAFMTDGARTIEKELRNHQ